MDRRKIYAVPFPFWRGAASLRSLPAALRQAHGQPNRGMRRNDFCGVALTPLLIDRSAAKSADV